LREAAGTIVARLWQAAAGAGGEPEGDAALLRRFVEGRDARAFEGLVSRHAPGVWAACRRVLRHEQDAEDAFQAVWVVLALKAGSVGRPGSLGPWLHRVAVRVALHARRRRSRLPAVADVEPATSPPPADGGLRERIDAEVDRLPENHRRAFVLCQLEGLTLEQAGAALGRPPATVGTWVARAKARLRGRLPAPCAPPPLAPGLAAAAVRAALHAAAGHPLAGAAPASVVTLVKGALNAMFFQKIQTAAVVAVACLAAGILGLAGLARGGRPAPPPVHAATAEKPEEKKADEGGGRAVQLKINEVEEAHYLQRYAELLREQQKAHWEARDADGDGKGDARMRLEAKAVAIRDEINEVKVKLFALERERRELGGGPAKGRGPASGVLERILDRLEALEKRK
jgi:RNA polymerase sigma factor (sigma-70 family)